jgi:hypothetical protein
MCLWRIYVFQPTSAHRPNWLIDATSDGMPGWLIPVCVGPAILFAILCVMDQHITAVIVNAPDHKLKVDHICPVYPVDTQQMFTERMRLSFGLVAHQCTIVRVCCVWPALLGRRHRHIDCACAVATS